jgi:tetratricopeptide (TPR) repeat protein
MTYVLSLIIYAYFCPGMVGWMCVIPFYMMVFELSLGRPLKKLLLTIPYFVIAGYSFLMSHYAVVNRVAEVKRFNLFNHLALNNNILLIITHSIFANAYEIFIPNHLSIYHEPLMITTPMLILEIGVVVALILAIIPLYRRFKPLFFGVGMFIATLLPTFTTIGVAWLLADRYNYLGSLILACLIAWLYSRFSKYGNWVVAGIAFLFMAYAYTTVVRNCDYATNHQFWLSTVKQNPMSPRAHSEMGRILLAEGNYNMAVMEFRNSTITSPSYDVGWANLGIAYVYQRDYAHAVESFEKAISLKTPLYMPYMQVGIIYLNSDMFDKAMVRFHQAYFRCKDKVVNKDLNKAWHIARRLKREKTR